MLRDMHRWTGSNYVAALLTAAGPEIDDVICTAHGGLVVFDDQYAVALRLQALQSVQQAGVVSRMQAYGRFIQNVAHAAQVGAELRC